MPGSDFEPIFPGRAPKSRAGSGGSGLGPPINSNCVICARANSAVTLVVDNRNSLDGAAGLHAFIIGISAYPHLPGGSGRTADRTYGLKQLSTFALSAYQMYTWLTSSETLLPKPLSTCRMLLSPSPSEIAKRPGLNSQTDRATTKAFLREALEWRRDVARRQDGIGLFYFAGHGVHSGGEILLLEDFGDGLGDDFANAISLNSVFDGTAPSMLFPDIARQQFYFIDACRVVPEMVSGVAEPKPTAAFPGLLSLRDNRTAPIFFATPIGGVARGLPGDDTLFSRALMKALSGGAGEPFDDAAGAQRWRVSVATLSNALDIYLRTDPDASDQQSMTEGRLSQLNTTVNLLAAAPPVDVVLELKPPDVVPRAIVKATDDGGRDFALPAPLKPHPYPTVWPAGYYKVAVRCDPAGQDKITPTFEALPPRFHKVILWP